MLLRSVRAHHASDRVLAYVKSISLHCPVHVTATLLGFEADQISFVHQDRFTRLRTRIEDATRRSSLNITFAYGHAGRADRVLQEYWLPSPIKFKNRWMSTGGGGFAINSGSNSLPGGIIYGAAAGITDGGFGDFSTNYDAVSLYANGTLNYDALYSFGYRGIRELTVIGREFTTNFFDTEDKVNTCYQGCSEGGRDGWSQVQRFSDAFDGAIIGAPAIRYGQQQVNHLFANVVLDYYPPPCELQKIVNETIAFCDPLDGKTDGVIARSDLCQIHFDLNSTIGKSYHCAATEVASLGFSFGSKRKRQMMGGSTGTEPEQNGTVSVQGVELVRTILKGLHDSKGRRAYINYQIGASFEDASTTYNTNTSKWELDIASTGGEWVARFINLVEASNLDTLTNVTYDTLKEWMVKGWYNGGGKILTFHGEQDDSIPTGSSVHFYESVRKTMYPDQSYDQSVAAMNDWYRLYLWVEKDKAPKTLNATAISGDMANWQLCSWPLRPMYSNNGTKLECEYDQASIDTWMYDFDAYKLPLY
ncbi:tannase and feruloyl esterase [Aureobasidium sp. EXF-8845]|nr:tannase and feruloyl esterase [Aureobasidium sp. EXF-8845]KAI4854966.1 tannase and feruloyl esterase [Aureobasidium sp. EXF-8846]